MKIRQFSVLGLALLLSTLAGDRPASAGDLIGPDLTLYRTDSEQGAPAVAYNTLHDEYLVVWEDSSGTGYDIRAVRLSATGGELAQFTVASGSDRRFTPDVAYDPVHDQYLVVFAKDYAPSDKDILGRLIPWEGADGNLPEFLIGGSTDNEVRPSVGFGQGGPPGGQFLVTWTTLTGTDAFITGSFVPGGVSSAGTPWHITPAGKFFDFSSPAYLESRGQFLVVAVDNYAASDEDVLGVILDTAGNQLSGGWFPIAASSEDENIPDVAAFPAADQWLVVFLHSMTNFDIKAQRVSGDGSLSGPAIEVDRSSFLATFPAVTCMQTTPGCCLIAWQQQHTLSYAPSGVEARMIGASGQPGPVLWVIDPSITGANRQRPDVAPGSPSFFAVWSHERDDTTSYDLHGSLVMPAVFLDGFESSDAGVWSTQYP